MGTLAKGDIVLYLFPFTDLKGQKLRPCLVLSNEMNQDVLLCQITSQKIRSDNYSIPLKKDETLNGTLSIDSFIRCNMLFTGDKNDIQKIICKINNQIYNDVCKKILELISKSN